MDKQYSQLGRRGFVVGLLGTFLAGCTARAQSVQPFAWRRREPKQTFAVKYAALPQEQFPIPSVAKGALDEKYQRQQVTYRTREKPGTVIVDTQNFFLYHVERRNRAMRYGVGLGRAGFAWSGRAQIAWKREWPTWTPPAEMIRREPHLARWSAENGGMPPGLDNPLGARALYIFQDGRDTLYRVHGTPQVSSIGRAVSSGCVRMVNQDVIHLYERVRPGSQIVVI